MFQTESSHKWRCIVFSFLFFFTTPFSFALSSADFSLAVEPFLGIRYGCVDEYVFLKESAYESDVLSELNWEIKPELYGGAKLRGGWKHLYAEAYLRLGIPMKSGSMMDSDWQNVANPLATNAQYKTNFSKSENYIDSDIAYGFLLGYTIPVRGVLYIEPYLSFSYERIAFTAQNGTAWYGKKGENGVYAPYTDEKNRDEISFDGKSVISYRREASFFYLGFTALVPFLERFSFTAGASLAPYVYAISYDSHLLRYDKGEDCDFADITPGWFGAYTCSAGLSYEFSKRQCISLCADSFFMRVLRGDDYQKKNTETVYAKSNMADGGARAWHISLTLSYAVTIF